MKAKYELSEPENDEWWKQPPEEGTEKFRIVMGEDMGRHVVGVVIPDPRQVRTRVTGNTFVVEDLKVKGVCRKWETVIAFSMGENFMVERWA